MPPKTSYWLFVCVMCITLFCGIYGYICDFGLSFDDAVYKTFTLFVLNDSDLPQSCLFINIARFLAPITIALGGIQTVYYLSRNSAESLFQLFLYRHIVICGFGTVGRKLYEEFAKKDGKCRFVLIDYETCPQVFNYRTLSIKGDAASAEIIRRARMTKAKEIYIVTGNDFQNLLILQNIIELQLSKKQRIFLRLESAELKESMDIQQKKDTENFSWKVLDLESPVLNKIQMPPKGKQLAILGCGSIGQKLIRKYHENYRIAVFEQSSRALTIFRSKNPQIPFDSYICDVTHIEKNEIKNENRTPAAIFICLGGDLSGIAASFHWSNICPNAEIHLFISHNGGLFQSANGKQSFLINNRIIVHPIIEYAIHALSENKYCNSSI